MFTLVNVINNINRYYVSRNAIYGNQTMTDGIIKDGLWDVYNQIQYVISVHY